MGTAVRISFALGIDALQVLTDEQLAAFAVDGMKFVGAYLFNGLDAAYAARVHNHGMSVLVLTVASTKEPLSAATGLQRGKQSVAELDRIGCPKGVDAVIDLESVPPESDPGAHVNAFGEELSAAGYPDSLYVGSGCRMTGHDLFRLHPARYMKAGSLFIPEPDCGFAMVQLSRLDRPIHGADVDYDAACEDFKGRAFSLWGA